MWHVGLVALRHRESSWTRDGTHIFPHGQVDSLPRATREAPPSVSFVDLDRKFLLLAELPLSKVFFRNDSIL